MKSIIITGGAGFVGSYLARLFRENFPNSRIVAFDNLHRSGSEINLEILKENHIEFVHGDVRVMSDLNAVEGQFDLLIEASAEPTVIAGIDGNPNYVIETNFNGAINCLNWARNHAGMTVFLSTSRAHSMNALNSVALYDMDSRFEIADHQEIPGVTTNGISEVFPTSGPRSFYGASKLAAEIFVEEYVSAYGLKAVINRCGVICGAGQFGKASQGIFTLWVANHVFKKPLTYTGYGGTGKQVRDLLHPSDLYRLILEQVEQIDSVSGQTFNIGGGIENSISLQEFTGICQKITENETDIASLTKTTTVDVPLYISDCTKAKDKFGWQPEVSVESIVQEVADWLKKNKNQLRNVIK